jgi:hypothetical protein
MITAKLGRGVVQSNVCAEEVHKDDDGTKEEENEDKDEAIKTTCSGRAVTKLTHLIEEYGASGYDNYLIGSTEAEQQYYKIMCKSNEFAFVGAGLGGGFTNTSELHVMKYKEAMASSNCDKWQKAVDEEHEKMLKHNVWKPVLRKDVLEGAKILTSTWAMKKKANGTYHVRMNARGYEQVDGEHYNKLIKAAPVANEITIWMILVLIVMASWAALVIDINGAFLSGELDEHVKCYLEVPEGFEKYYSPNVMLMLLRTLYSMIQAAYAFWTMFLNAMWHMKYNRSKADPCL